MSVWVFLVCGMALTVATGVFVAAEFSLVTLDRHELERRRAGGERGLDLVIRGLRITSTHLSSAQLGITLTTLLAGYMFEPALSALFEPLFAAAGASVSLQRAISAPIAIAIATVLSMLVGELIPKNFALAAPLAAARIVMPAQTVFTAVCKPVVLLFNGSANRLLRLVGIEPREELSGARTAEELSSLVRHSAHAGLLEADTASLLDRTLRFAEHTAADVMTPRTSIEYVHRLDSAQTVLQRAGRTGFSRFPVAGEDRDDVVGVVHVKQAVAVPRAKREQVPVAAILEEAKRVPETMRLDALLELLRSGGLQLAVVVDEYGGIAGLVTLEDLVEELVGEVADEHDRAHAGVVGDAAMLTIPADLRPDEVREQTSVEVPDSDDYDTIAGFVLLRLGRIPEVGDEVPLADGARLRVERMTGRRISRLRYLGAADAAPDATAEAPA